MVSLNLYVKRYDYGHNYTQGRFLVEGMDFGESMEAYSRHLRQDMPLSEIKAKKVYGETCIPMGKYLLTWAYSPKFHDRYYVKPEYKGKFPLINNVPAWEGCLIHPFNKGVESKGCVSVGEKMIPGYIKNAAKGYQDLMDYYLLNAFKINQPVYLTITEE